MAALTTILILFAVANCARSLRSAYRAGRDLNDGGYPIYGDAIHNTIALGLAAFFSGLSENVYTPYQRAIGWSAVAMLVVNVALIALLVKAGERRRSVGKKDR
jgi:hypothetical protein